MNKGSMSSRNETGEDWRRERADGPASVVQQTCIRGRGARGEGRGARGEGRGEGIMRGREGRGRGGGGRFVRGHVPFPSCRFSVEGVSAACRNNILGASFIGPELT